MKVTLSHAAPDAESIGADLQEHGLVRLQAPDDLERERHEIQQMLQGALCVEQSTIPPYLTALYSLKPAARWRAPEALRSVVTEEMLHLVLAANVLSAIGGTPRIYTRDVLRDYPTPLPYDIGGDLELSLISYGPAAIQQGLAIESPEPLSPHRLATAISSESVAGLTIGEFYHLISAKLAALAEAFGDHRVFTGAIDRQVHPAHYYYDGGADVVVVHNCESALKAMAIIAEQGEGAHDSVWSDPALAGTDLADVAHYYKFKELEAQRLFQRGDTPAGGPTGPMMEIPDDPAWVTATNAKVADYDADPPLKARAEAFNRDYCQLLLTIERAFAGEADLLIGAVVEMLRLRDAAQRLIGNPHPTLGPEVHAAPTFEFVDGLEATA